MALDAQTDARLRERMNWDDEAAISLEGFLVEWQRASARSSAGDAGMSTHLGPSALVSALEPRRTRRRL